MDIRLSSLGVFFWVTLVLQYTPEYAAHEYSYCFPPPHPSLQAMCDTQQKLNDFYEYIVWSKINFSSTSKLTAVMPCQLLRLPASP